MNTIRCDAPGCASYYMHQPTAAGVESELLKRGWNLDGGVRVCPTCALQFVAVKKRPTVQPSVKALDGVE